MYMYVYVHIYIYVRVYTRLCLNHDSWSMSSVKGVDIDMLRHVLFAPAEIAAFCIPKFQQSVGCN